MPRTQKAVQDAQNIYWDTIQFTKPLNKKQLEIVKNDLEFNFYYAENILKARWPEAEVIVLKGIEKQTVEIDNVIGYCARVIGGRWPELEEKIISKKITSFATEYAARIIKNPWSDAEGFIAENAGQAVRYAVDVIEGRFENAESVIKKDPYAANRYAKEVLKARWPEAEEAILSNPQCGLDYCREFIKDRWPELEEKILGNVHLCMDYVDITKKRWLALENRLIKLKSPQKIIRYLNTVGKVGEELHNKMILLSFQDRYKDRVSQYFSLIEEKKKRYRQFVNKMSKWINKYKGKTVDEVLEIMEKDEYQCVE